MQFAVLGMGQIGRALAARLAAGRHDVVVWNRSAGKADELVGHSIRAAASISDATTGTDVVITALSDDDAVRAVALGPDGVSTSAPAATVYVDASTISPALSNELAGTFPRFAQLPVLGSPDAVRNGEASYLLGTDPDTADRLAPMVEALGGRVRRYPRSGLAATAKLTSNLLLLAGVAALAEAFTVARAGGLDDRQIRDLLADSPLIAPGVGNRFESLLTGATDGWWTTTLAAKDAGLAVDLTSGNPDLPVARAVRERYRAAAEAGFSGDDMVAIAHLYR